MNSSNSKISVELMMHGKRKTIPIVLDALSTSLFFSLLILLILSENNIHVNAFFKLSILTLIIIGLMSFFINMYVFFNWQINDLRYITGKIILTETSITIDNLLINIDDIEKVHFKAYNTRKAGRGLGDGANNEITIKTTESTINQKFMLEDKAKREELKNYAFFLKTKHLLSDIQGIDLV
ncbi:hypothetical protein ACFSJW_18510 [Flavobacterium artemisiae]|uniref:PH domain-containing protein n=1 Tax=Flavobacterium artemisiae TaxID=2126556 RepID=A0ABW4HAE3_9FLAO